MQTSPHRHFYIDRARYSSDENGIIECVEPEHVQALENQLCQRISD
jgi:hypothetical protein